MIGLFQRWLLALIAFAFDLGATLVRGIFGAPFEAARRMLGAVDVRRANAGEVVDLRHRVLRAGRPREDAIWPGDDEPETRHWVALHDGRIVGVATVLKASREGIAADWQLRGMAVDPDFQGQGVGRALLERIESEVGEPMWCNARVNAVSFYERGGWVAASEVFEITGVGPHRRMTRQLP